MDGVADPARGGPLRMTGPVVKMMYTDEMGLLSGHDCDSLHRQTVK